MLCRATLLCLLSGGAVPVGAAQDIPDPKDQGSPPQSAPALEKTWRIHLDRPARPGQRYTLSATGFQNRRIEITSPIQPVEATNEHIEVVYSAVHKVKKIDLEGRPTEVLIRIDRLTTNDGSGPVEQLPAGTAITATASGDLTRYLSDREELDGTLADALNLAGAKLPSSKEPSEDAVFLNHLPRSLGERWTADPQRLADAIAATTTFIIDPVTSTGEIRFDREVSENGIPALATTATFNIAPTGLRDSPGQTLTKSSIISTTSRIHPVDPALPLLKEELRTEMRIIRRTRSGLQPAGSDTTFKREVIRRYHPLAADGPE